MSGKTLLVLGSIAVLAAAVAVVMRVADGDADTVAPAPTAGSDGSPAAGGAAPQAGADATAPTPAPAPRELKPEELLATVHDGQRPAAERVTAVQLLAAVLRDGTLASHHEAARAALRACLEDDDAQVQNAALTQLTRLHDTTAAETAVRWLAAEDHGDRALAVRCVKELGRKDQIPQLRTLLHSDDEDVRVEAMIALANWGDTDSRDAFQAAAESSSPRLRATGEQALAKLDTWAEIRKQSAKN
jgi:hypothetical protein